MFYFSGRLPLVQAAVPVKSILCSIAPWTIESIMGWGTRKGLVVISTISRAHFTFDFHKNCKTQNLFLKYYCFMSLPEMRLLTAKTGRTTNFFIPNILIEQMPRTFFKFHLHHSLNYSTVQSVPGCLAVQAKLMICGVFLCWCQCYYSNLCQFIGFNLALNVTLSDWELWARNNLNILNNQVFNSHCFVHFRIK